MSGGRLENLHLDGFTKHLPPPYLDRLSKIVALIHTIGTLYNEVMKVLNTYHFTATAQRLISKLKPYS